MSESVTLTSASTDAEISAIVLNARSKGFTHVQVTASGLEMANKIFKLDELPSFRTQDVTFTLGVKLAGLPFEDRPLTSEEKEALTNPPAPAPKATSKATSSTPKAKKVAPKVKAPAKAKVTPKAKKETKKEDRGSGFIALVDELLLTPGEKADGFPRSKFTVDEALAKVMAKFPDKVPASVKKIIKVRPRHLEKRKDDRFDDKNKRAPRWAVIGSGKNGSMAEIDACHAKKAAAEAVAAEFARLHGRDPKKTLAVVKARYKVLDKRAKDVEKAKAPAKAKKP